ncbi:PIN domain-containing protein [Persephonella sp.]
MKVVIDANIIFSALIKGNPVYLKILNNMDVYAPDFLLLEIEKYEKKILKKTQNRKRFKRVLYKTFEEISIIPRIGISKRSFKKAYEICKDVDEKDIPYVALSIELKAPFWTNDKKLIKRLKESEFPETLTTEELLKLIDNM